MAELLFLHSLPMQTGTGDRATAAVRILGLAIAACRAYGRDDLIERLERRLELAKDPGVAVVVLGEFKQGKSTLVNALLGIDLCPVDDDIATAVPTVLRHGQNGEAVVHLETPGEGADEAQADHESKSEGPAERVSFEEVRAVITGGGEWAARAVRSVEIAVSRPLLDEGLAVVDTPGVGGLVSAHGAAAMGTLAQARAAVFVSDASQELTAPEVAALRRAQELCPHVVVALTKIDIHPHWRRIAEINREHLQRAGLDVPIMPVSSLLRIEAQATGDSSLNEESGFPALVGWLRDEVLARADEALAVVAAQEVDQVTTQLAAQFESELRVLDAPAAAAAVMTELEEARQRAEALDSGAARWQTALADGSADLSSDIEHDLRGRFRQITSAADERIDSADPLDIWDEFELWLRQQVTEQVAANHQELVARADSLAGEIAELFASEAEPTGVGDLGGPSVSAEGIEIDLQLNAKAASLLDTGLGVMRGGYGGMLMFGMLASMVGVTLIAPVSVAIGLAMGRKQQREEQRRQLLQRRQAAKSTYRAYVDQVSFVVSKQSRDAVRHLHRDLRDTWSERAKELQRSAREALVAAESAGTTAVADVERRRADVKAELQRIAALRGEARKLLAGPVGSSGAGSSGVGSSGAGSSGAGS